MKSAAGFRGFGSQPLRLDVEVHAPAAHVPGDATNYLGGIADALEIKKARIKASGPLEHLDYRQHVGLYGNDRQLKEIHYREVVDEHCAYIVRLQPIH